MSIEDKVKRIESLTRVLRQHPLTEYVLVTLRHVDPKENVSEHGWIQHGWVARSYTGAGIGYSSRDFGEGDTAESALEDLFRKLVKEASAAAASSPEERARKLREALGGS